MILLFILLMAGTVEAGEHIAVPYGNGPRVLPSPPPTCKIWWKSAGDGNITHQIVCDGDEPIDMKEITCYQKMQEVMKAADSYILNPAPYMPPQTVEEREERYRIRKQVGEQWDQTMKECVR